MMKNKHLNYFLNKICTIFTVPTNRDFKEENPTSFPQPIFHYFVGKILEIDDNGIIIQQWNNGKKLKSYFFIDHIISVCEEEILDPTQPEDAKVIEEYRKINEKTIASTEKMHQGLKEQQKIIKENPDLDLDSLMEISKKINKS